MQGMSPQDFGRKLQKLNPRLWVDHTKKAVPYHKDYPTCGLYFDSEYVMGVAQDFQPENTVAGVDLERLHKRKEYEILEAMDRTGFIPAEHKENVQERILWRGYKAILTALCLKNFIKKDKAERLFRCEIDLKKQEYPRLFVQLTIK